MRITWALLGGTGILLSLLLLFGTMEQSVFSFQQTNEQVSPAKSQPRPLVFKAKVAKNAVEALPGGDYRR